MHAPTLAELRAIHAALQNGTRSPRPLSPAHFVRNIAANMLARADEFDAHVKSLIVGTVFPEINGIQFSAPAITYTAGHRARALVSARKMRADALEFARLELAAIGRAQSPAPVQLPMVWNEPAFQEPAPARPAF